MRAVEVASDGERLDRAYRPRKDNLMNRTSLIMAASVSLAFAYAIVVSHVPTSKTSDPVACGDSDAKKKKSDKKDEDNT